MFANEVPKESSVNLSLMAQKKQALQNYIRNLSCLKKFTFSQVDLIPNGKEKLLDSLEQLAQSRRIIKERN